MFTKLCLLSIIELCQLLCQVIQSQTQAYHRYQLQITGKLLVPLYHNTINSPLLSIYGGMYVL